MLQMEVPVSRIYEDAPTMTEVLAFVEQHGFQPVAMFPITKLEDWRAAELDYLGVNRNVSANPRSG